MASISTLNYALPPDVYFWRWSEDGSAIESLSGKTMAFRQEILTILQSLAEADGIPPLGSLLILNAACIGQIDDFFEGYDAITRTVDSEEKTKAFGEALRKTLVEISSLPAELRTGIQAKTRLFHTFFSRTTWSHQGEKACQIAHELTAENPALWLTQNGAPQAPAQRLLRDCRAIIKSAAGITAKEFENKIHTGLEFTELSSVSFDQDFPAEKEDSRSLLEQLQAAGGETGAIATVAKQVIGLVSIPQPSQAEDTLHIGGVSDIINRGSPDKLLVSELAWGDEILATRLAQNEALFYQRETPPQRSPYQRLILMDHGLRYWGLLRLYALAAHLGLRFQDSKNKELPIKTFVGTDFGYQPLPLDSVVDIQAALTQLPVHLDFTPAVSALALDLLDEVSEGPTTDVFLVASAGSLQSPELLQVLDQLTSTVRRKGGRLFSVNIDADGSLFIVEHRARGNRVLQKGQLDLDDLLSAKDNSPTKPKASQQLRAKTLEEVTGSKFYTHYPLPIEFYSHPARKDRMVFNSKTQSYLGVDTNQRLMEWSDRSDRAIERSPKLPGREHWVFTGPYNCIVIACSAQKAGESVTVWALEETGHLKEIPIAPSKHSFPSKIELNEDQLLVFYPNSCEVFNLNSGKVIHSEKLTFQLSVTNRHIFSNKRVVIKGPDEHLERLIEFFESPSPIRDNFQTIHPASILFDENGFLFLYQTEEEFILDHASLSWIPTGLENNRLAKAGPHAFAPSGYRSHPTEDDIKTVLFGELVVSLDQRGLMHLSFADESWTLTLNTGKFSSWKSKENLDKEIANNEELQLFLIRIQNHVKGQN